MSDPLSSNKIIPSHEDSAKHNYYMRYCAGVDPVLCRDEKFTKARVSMTPNSIRVDCTEISVEAAEWLLEQHKKHYAVRPNIRIQ